jgi:hypothetical protein
MNWFPNHFKFIDIGSIKRKNNYKWQWLLFWATTFFIGIIIGPIVFRSECFAQTPKTVKQSKKQKIHLVSGLAFRAGKALYFDFGKSDFDYSEIYKSLHSSNNSKTDVLKDYAISFFPGELYVYDRDKDDTHLCGYNPHTQKIYFYKIENEKGYVGNKSGEWSPLNIKFIKNITDESDPNEEYSPCMLVHLECKWFSGDYIMMCS